MIPTPGTKIILYVGGGMEITIGDNGSGSITSDLHEEVKDALETECDGEERLKWQLYESAVDGIESLVLAHALEGVHVQDSRYIAGIRTALEAVVNNI